MRAPLLIAPALLALLLPAAPDRAALRVDEETLRRAGLGSDGPALLAFFRDRTLSHAEQDELGVHGLFGSISITGR